MKNLTAEVAPILLQEALLPNLKTESRVTRMVLEAVPADKPDYRPDPNAKSAMELVRHIAAAEIRFMATPVNGVFNPDSPTMPEGLKPAEVSA